MVLATRRSNPTLKALVCRKLLSDGPCKTLVNLVGTGDRVIQNAIEAQSNWENGPGVELASLVELAMTVFELLLASTDDKSALGDLNKLVGAESFIHLFLRAYLLGRGLRPLSESPVRACFDRVCLFHNRRCWLCTSYNQRFTYVG